MSRNNVKYRQQILDSNKACRLKRIEEGKCPRHPQSDPAPGRKYCVTCLANEKRRVMARHHRLLNSGLCTACARRPLTSKWYCDECSAKRKAACK